MPNFRERVLLALLTAIGLACFLSGFPVGLGPNSAWGQDEAPTIVEDEDMAPGVAASWLVGHRLLAEGLPADALQYLHMAYRELPEVIVIAMDFQAALASEGYLRDALNVMDGLVAAWPDSQSFRMRRSALNLSAGHRDKALDDLREIRRRGQATVEVLAAESSILAAEGKTGQALDVLRDGLHLYPERGRDLYLEMARILRNAQETEALPGLMDEALVKYPDDPMLWLVKIKSLASLSRDEEALAAAQQADRHFAELPLAPDDGGQGGSFQIEDQLPEPAVPGVPADSFTVELADYYAQNNQIDQALAILQPLSAKDELGLTPSLWLARLLLGTGREKEGVALVEKILNQWPDSARGWFLKGKVEEGGGDWEKSIPHFRQAAELDPYDPEIRLGIVRALLVAHDEDLRSPEPDAAQKKLTTEFRDHVMIASTLVSEKDTEGQMMLGYSFRLLGELERAAWRFELAANNPELRLTALIQQSICNDENGEVAKARSALELLRREFPDDPEVANSLGYFLAEKGQDLDLAEGLIREALTNNPGNGAYLDSLGWVLYRHGRLEEAFDYLIRAVNVLPEDPVILEHLGVVLNDMGQTAEALDVLKRSLNRGGDSERIGALIEKIENRSTEKE